MKKEYVIVYTTTGNNDEARKIAETLVNENLAACVQMSPVTSVYRWGGNVLKDKEILLAAKTVKSRYKKVEGKIKELHTYECPEIIAVPVTEGSKDYLKWISENAKH